MTRTSAALWSLLTVFGSLCLLVEMLGCPRPPQPPAPPLPPAGYARCPDGARPVAEDVCERRFTTEGFACVKCPPAAAGCFVQVYSVYCVERGSCADPRCHIEPGP